MFGPHLILEAYGIQRDLLGSVQFTYTFLDMLPEMIGMTKIAPPNVFHYSGKVPEDCGVTGIVLIAESHISIHTFAEKGFIVLDVFSCKSFDAEEVVKIFNQHYQPKQVEHQVLLRGREFPRSEVRADQIVRDERERIRDINIDWR